MEATPALTWGGLDLDLTKPGRDSARGLGLAAAIGIPGLGLYFLSRSLELNVTIVASDLSPYWWSVPMLLLLALRAGVLEEVIGVGYLFARLEQLRVPMGGSFSAKHSCARATTSTKDLVVLWGIL